MGACKEEGKSRGIPGTDEGARWDIVITSNLRSLASITRSTRTKEIQERQHHFQKERKQADWAGAMLRFGTGPALTKAQVWG